MPRVLNRKGLLGEEFGAPGFVVKPRLDFVLDLAVHLAAMADPCALETPRDLVFQNERKGEGVLAGGERVPLSKGVDLEAVFVENAGLLRVLVESLALVGVVHSG